MEEIKKEEPKVEIKPEVPPTDFKVAEIWIKSGQLFLEAPHEFWRDKIRAVGMLSYCIDLVKEARVPEDKKIIVPGNGGLKHKIMNFARNFKRRK